MVLDVAYKGNPVSATTEGHTPAPVSGPVDTSSGRNGMGTAALVVGVVALVLAALLIFFPIAFILGILAVIFGALGIRRADRGEANNKGHAIAGLVCGALAFLLAVSIGVRLGTFINDHSGDFRSFWTCITSAPTESEQQGCGERLARQLDEG
jgi:Domain of unknown function (DUF4190)